MSLSTTTEPLDEPEGAAWVLMSVTLFKQWVDQRPDVVILDWGQRRPWTGDIYVPTISVVKGDEHE